MKQAVVTIHRKGLDQFEGHSKVSIGWFKLGNGSKFIFLQLIHNSINNLKKEN